MNKQRYELGVTLPDRVPSPDNNSDCGTKCQKAADFLRLYRRLKCYSESYIPPDYNLKQSGGVSERDPTEPEPESP